MTININMKDKCLMFLKQYNKLYVMNINSDKVILAFVKVMIKFWVFLLIYQNRNHVGQVSCQASGTLFK